MLAENPRQGCGDEKVLLLEPQLFSGVGLIARVEDFGDGFVAGLVLDRPDVVAIIENGEIEVVAGDRAPEGQWVRDTIAPARDQDDRGYGPDGFLVVPMGLQAALGVGAVVGLPAEANPDALIRTRDLPGLPR